MSETPVDLGPGPETGVQLDALVAALRGRAVVALTGAGCSTESGLPDYRGPGTKRRARNPMPYREYLRDPSAQARYWARSVVGWRRFGRARPNRAHTALAALERHGRLAGIITQNVDRLHHAAGSQRVVELHGALAEVRCLACGRFEDRDHLQARLLALNPGWATRVAVLAPDGDAALPAEWVPRFRVAHCEYCDGPLKPNVVFFGENVPKDVLERAWKLFEQAELLLVVGSSLAVFSGYRFVKKASQRGLPIAIVNRGQTRADALAQVCVDATAGELLPQLLGAL